MTKVLELQHQSNEYSGFIFFGINWFDVLSVQGTHKSLLQHHNSKASILPCSAFFMVQFSHMYMTTGKKKHSFDYMDIAKKWCLCFLICCLGVYYFPSKEQRSFSFIDSVTICNAFGAQEKKICHCFQFFLFYLLWSDRTGSHDLSFINVEFQARLFTLLFHPHQEAL